jgi:hypothetical protein
MTPEFLNNLILDNGPPIESAPVTGMSNPGSMPVSIPEIDGVGLDPGFDGIVVGGTDVAVGSPESPGSSGVEVGLFVAVGSPGSPGSPGFSGVAVGVYVAVGSGVSVAVAVGIAVGVSVGVAVGVNVAVGASAATRKLSDLTSPTVA